MSTDSPTPTTTATYNDLNDFQQDILLGARAIELDQGEPGNGLEIADVLEEHLGYDDISAGWLYPNLNTLAGQNLIEKTPLDDRSNHYAVTDESVAMLEARVQQEASLCGLTVPDRAAADGGDV